MKEVKIVYLITSTNDLFSTKRYKEEIVLEETKSLEKMLNDGWHIRVAIPILDTHCAGFTYTAGIQYVLEKEM